MSDGGRPRPTGGPSYGERRLAEETRERFLREIVARVPLDRLAAVHLFRPIRQGGFESGVAVVAAEPPAAAVLELPVAVDAPIVPAAGPASVGEEAVAAVAADSDVVAPPADVEPGADAIGEPPSDPTDAAAGPAAGEADEATTVAEASLADAVDAAADADVSVADAVDAGAASDDAAGAASPEPSAEPSDEAPDEASDEAPAGPAALDAGEPGDAASAATTATAGVARRTEPGAAATRADDDSDDDADDADEDASDASDAEPPVDRSPAVAEPRPTRHTVFTARYRLAIKGPDRGKWDVEVVEEADAPMVTVEAVVRGVQRRAGDEGDPPERLDAAAIARLVGAPRGAAPP